MEEALTQRELDMLGLLSGDKNIGNAVLADQDRRKDLQKTIRSGRPINMGQGIIYNPQTGAYSDIPGYREAQENRDEAMLRRMREGADFRSRQPKYETEETAGGITPIQVNPRFEGGTGAGEEIAVTPRPNETGAREAGAWERAAATTESLLGDPGLEGIGEGVFGRGKQAIVAGASAIHPMVRSLALDATYSDEQQKSLQKLNTVFAQTIKEFAGAAQTEGEKANIMKFMPHEDQSPQQLQDSITGFVDYANSRAQGLRNPYQSGPAPSGGKVRWEIGPDGEPVRAD